MFFLEFFLEYYIPGNYDGETKIEPESPIFFNVKVLVVVVLWPPDFLREVIVANRNSFA